MTSADDQPPGAVDTPHARSHPDVAYRPTCQPDGQVPSEQEAAALADVRWHWDQAYEINCVAGTWTARYVDDTALLSAASEPALRALIRQDYFERRAEEIGALRAAIDAENAAMGAGERALRKLAEDGVI